MLIKKEMYKCSVHLLGLFRKENEILKTLDRQPDNARRRNSIVIMIMMKLELLEGPFIEKHKEEIKKS